ncbi:Oidioi.mRNA.OKI2018_I69.XSR.g14867.t1.cds [Oikopleura dioica]|uniref:Oidioi.mRNA.OKI2018_I69.XSR.g14867.t1.cds n=1 Tax=Oikopleura dioica TaxID=34765 RepID=A0ABN7SBI9_OIKDI|nr:Oidioi.mRNA.OKI2018_I69.XSR.g14867.t1.cds [Oikopleura dioica]
MKIFNLIVFCAEAARKSRDRRTVISSNETVIYLDMPDGNCGPFDLEEGYLNEDCSSQASHGDSCPILGCYGESISARCDCTTSFGGILLKSDECRWKVDEESYQTNCVDAGKCEELQDDFGSWSCSDGLKKGSVCELTCVENYSYNVGNGRRRKCKCKNYKGGNPKNRPEKMRACQWSAKRNRFRKISIQPAFRKIFSTASLGRLVRTEPIFKEAAML